MIDGEIVQNPITLTLGASLQIEISMNGTLGTSIESVPPLPSTLSLSLTSLSGMVIAPLDQTFTLVARNSKGEVSTTLHIQTDPCNPYTFRLIQGNAYLKIELDSRILHDKTESGGFMLTSCFSQGTLSSFVQCLSVLGCWVGLETESMYQPPRFIHYSEEVMMEWELPLTKFSVKPIVTESSTLLGWPFSTILWSVEGFVKNVELVGLPEWMEYDQLENSIHGIAQEVGFFEGSIQISGQNETVSLKIRVDVFDLFSLPSNITLLTLKETNDYHSPCLTVFSVNDTSIDRTILSLPTYFTHSFSQVLILPEGSLTFPFSQ